MKPLGCRPRGPVLRLVLGNSLNSKTFNFSALCTSKAELQFARSLSLNFVDVDVVWDTKVTLYSRVFVQVETSCIVTCRFQIIYPKFLNKISKMVRVERYSLDTNVVRFQISLPADGKYCVSPTFYFSKRVGSSRPCLLCHFSHAPDEISSLPSLVTGKSVCSHEIAQVT